MNTPDPVPPMPTDFGFKWILWNVFWCLWSNAVTILTTLQLVFLWMQGDPTDPTSHPVVDHTVAHYVYFANGILSIVLLQIKRRKPDLFPAPTKT